MLEKCRARGVTDAWVSGTHAEHAMTKTLERRFSAGSSGGAGAAMLHGNGNPHSEISRSSLRKEARQAPKP
jgi:hypothetical protein